MGLIINRTKIGKIYEIKGKDFTLKIKPTNTSIFDNSTNINFDKCENILRHYYNLSNSSIITFFQLELENNDSQSLIDQVEYLTIDEQKVILNQSLCQNVTIEINYLIKEGIYLNIPSISSFSDSGIDVFNIKDSFFTDLCYSFSNSDNDIILEDRIKYIYQNYSLCDTGCTLNNINIKNMTISCDCKVKENISTVINPLNLAKEKESSILDSNIFVLKCYNLVFSFEGKIKNIGFWLILVLLIINLIFLFSYCINGIKPIIKYIFDEMVKFGYLERNSKMFFKEKNNLREKETIEKPKKTKFKKRKSNKTISNPNKNKKDFNRKGTKKISRKNTNRISQLKIKENDLSNSVQKLKLIHKNKLINNGSKAGIKSKKFINKKHRKYSNITTGDYTKNGKNKENSENFGIIKINLNNIKNYYPQDSYQTLHNYTFEEAIEYDRRSILKIFYIYLLSKQIIFHTFFQKNPLELFSLRICLFIFMISTDLALNSLLYLNDNISKKYHYTKGLFLFTFSNNLTVILLSTLISFILISLIGKLNNSTNEIRNVFREEEKKNKKYKIQEKTKQNIFLKVENILKNLKIKIFILIIIEILLILFFWYFITAFCHVYSNTQKSWLLDSFFSFLSRVIIELLFSLLFAKLYIISVESNCYSLYRALLFIYEFS